MKKILFLLMLFVAVSCSKEENSGSNDQVTLIVNIINVTDHEATLSWTLSDGNAGTLYRIVLNGEVKRDAYAGTQFTIIELNPEVNYQGVLFAVRQNETVVFSEFSFRTLEDLTYDGNYRINTQQKADDFKFTKISGILLIDGSDVTDLSNLSSLIEVGSIRIHNCLQLTSLEGLQNIESYTVNDEGFIIISQNHLLEDVTALANISSKTNGLQLIGNNSLTDITGLGLGENANTLYILNSPVESFTPFVNLKHLGLLHLENLPELESLSGLDNIESIEELNLSELPGLVDLYALNNLTELDQLILDDLPNLVDIDGLSNLAEIGPTINLNDLPSLKTIDGLSNITEISGFYLHISIAIHNCDLLTNLDAFTNSISNNANRHYISISRNDVLSDFCGLRNLILTCPCPFTIQISDNLYNPTYTQLISPTECSQ